MKSETETKSETVSLLLPRSQNATEHITQTKVVNIELILN